MLTRILVAIVEYTGLGHLIRTQVARRRVTVLLYHDPLPSVFAEHINFLCRHYNAIPFADVLTALDTGNWESIPDYALVIHLDDGYKRNFELLDILESNHVRPTLYICSHVTGTNRRFWSKLNRGDSKKLRHLSHSVLLEKLNREANYTPEAEFTDRQALSQSEIRALSKVCDIQSHGRFHFSAPTLSEEELRAELEESRTRASALSGQPCLDFSAPYGDYSAREIEAARESGYRSLRTTRPGWIHRSTDPFEIPITADVEDDASLRSLRFHLTGIPRFLKRSVYVLFTRHLYAVRQKLLASRPFFEDVGPEIVSTDRR